MTEKGEPMENLKCCVPDYEAEYRRMCDTCDKLMAENDYLRKDKDAMETEFVRMRAQLDIVYLIFGGRR